MHNCSNSDWATSICSIDLATSCDANLPNSDDPCHEPLGGVTTKSARFTLGVVRQGWGAVPTVSEKGMECQGGPQEDGDAAGQEDLAQAAGGGAIPGERRAEHGVPHPLKHAGEGLPA